MSERHIVAWSGFMTIYHEKNSFREGKVDISIMEGGVKTDAEIEPAKGVTPPELAEACGFSNETARRRLSRYEEHGLVEDTNDESKFSEYVPKVSTARMTMKLLESI